MAQGHDGVADLEARLECVFCRGVLEGSDVNAAEAATAARIGAWAEGAHERVGKVRGLLATASGYGVLVRGQLGSGEAAVIFVGRANLAKQRNFGRSQDRHEDETSAIAGPRLAR